MFRKIDLVDERSEQITEVLGKKPIWMIRWGTTIAFGFILLIVILSWVVKYPDVLIARINITTNMPPIRLVAQSSGEIMLLVKDGENVKKNQILGVIRSATNTKDIQYLMFLLDSVATHLYSIDSLPISPNLQLGEIQPLLVSFTRSKDSYSFFKKYDPIIQDIKAIESEINRYKELQQEQEVRFKILQEKLAIVQSDYNRSLKLYQEGVIAERAFEEVKSQLLNSKDLLQSMVLEITTTKVKLSSLQEQINRLNITNVEREQELKQTIDKSYSDLSSAINKWKDKYALVAPFDGKISLSKYWTDNQYVENGNEVMVIISKNESHQIVGKMVMPVENSGKVRPGQRVNIMLDNYPYHEYGILVGKIATISEVPREDQYAVEVEFKNGGLKTSYNKTLPFNQELKGKAEIVTEDLRLLERVIYFLRSVNQ